VDSDVHKPPHARVPRGADRPVAAFSLEHWPSSQLGLVDPQSLLRVLVSSRSGRRFPLCLH
jgi:hypothetical protein